MTTHKHTFMAALLLSASTLFAAPSSAEYKEKVGNQTIASAPDVYRIELSHLRNFHVLTTGDNNDGELHKMMVKLSGRDGQWQAVQETAHYMASWPNRDRTSSYVKISPGGGIAWADDTADHENYRLIIYQREYTVGDVGEKLVEFNIDIDGVDLDCAGARVCDDQDKGRVSYRGVMPVPTMGNTACGLDNSFTIESTDGNLWLRPKTRGRSSYPLRPVGSGGPQIALGSNAELCIAKSATSDDCDRTDLICRELQRKSASPVMKKVPTIPKVTPNITPKTFPKK